jgi:hypothetical protein
LCDVLPRSWFIGVIGAKFATTSGYTLLIVPKYSRFTQSSGDCGVSSFVCCILIIGTNFLCFFNSVVWWLEIYG